MEEEDEEVEEEPAAKDKRAWEQILCAQVYTYLLSGETKAKEQGRGGSTNNPALFILTFGRRLPPFYFVLFFFFFPFFFKGGCDAGGKLKTTDSFLYAREENKQSLFKHKPKPSLGFVAS